MILFAPMFAALVAFWPRAPLSPMERHARFLADYYQLPYKTIVEGATGGEEKP